jgi:thioesterase domain-containing protein/acyl carrier protein
VKQAAVLAKTDPAGGKRLVGYVVPEGVFDKAAILAHLKNQLPEYMVPSLLVEMEQLPLTSNGKIDRNALPEVDAGILLQNEYVAPRNETEQELAAIWQELLRVEKVGVFDNFFELGGHSLLAIRFIYLLNKKLETQLSISDVFIHPTIAKLATLINPSVESGKASEINFKYLVSLKKGSGKKPPLYIICGGGGTALRFKGFAEMLDEDQAVYSFQPPIEMKALKNFPGTIEQIATLFIGEMLLNTPDGSYALAGHCVGGIIAFEMSKQLEAMNKKVHLLAMFDTIIRDVKKERRSDFKNLYNIPALVKGAIFKTILKFNFETFLLKNYTRKAIGYKMRHFEKLVNGFKSKTSQETLKNVGYEIFHESSNLYVAATRKYMLSHYDREIILFYAKERYYFTDANNNIRYKKIHLDNHTKNIWSRFAGSVTIFDVEGDHSDMFETSHGNQFAMFLQQELNKPARD